MSGTMSGPGAIARPDRRADQPQASCSQSTIREEHRTERGREEDCHQRRPREMAGSEQGGLHERRSADHAVEDEKADEDCSKKKGPKNARRPPAPAAALHQPEGDARHAGRDEHHAERSGPLDRLARDVRQSAPPDDQGGYTDRHVDQEDQPPVHRDQ